MNTENTVTRCENADTQSNSPAPAYEPPNIITYTSEEILAAIGPAQACSPSPCPVGN